MARMYAAGHSFWITTFNMNKNSSMICDTAKIPHTLEVMERLRLNAHLVKRSHFQASKRRSHYHIACGLPIIIVNLILGSVFFTQISTLLPQWCYWLGAALALTAALLGGIQTFFNFKGSYEGHREMGNQYLAIARECERIIALFFDQQISLEALSEKLEQLNIRYANINQQAEAFAVNDRDYRKALQEQRAKLERNPSLFMRHKNASE